MMNMKAQFIEPNRNKTEYIIGIDFGHGETSAAYCRIDDRNNPIDIDFTGHGAMTIPSTLFIEKGNNIVSIGDDAVFQSKEKEGVFHAYFKEAPKNLDEEMHPNLEIMKLYMQKVYECICNRYASLFMDGNKVKDNHVVFIACPSKYQSWTDKEMQNYVHLALDAGLPIAGASIDNKFQLSGIVRESRAAYIRFMQQNDEKITQAATKGILVIDFGSSTIDMTYYKQGEKPVDKGYPYGAQRVENSIYDFIINSHSQIQIEEPLLRIKCEPTNIAQKIDCSLPWKNSCLFEIRKEKERFYTQGQNARNFQYRSDMAELLGGDIDTRIPKNIITEKILANYIIDIADKVFNDFKIAILKDNPVTLLVLTGGASRMDFVEVVAHNVFGDIDVMPSRDSSLTVSNGIATAGRADVLLYYLAKDLLSGNQTKIYSKVREKAIFNICETVLSKVQSAYSSFYNGNLSKNTINALEQRVKSNINDIQYKDELSRAFKPLMENYINKELAIYIKDYLSKHFPHYNISEVTDYLLPPNVSMQFSTNSLQTLSNVISDAVNEITEGFIGKVAIVAFNIIFGALVIAVDGSINAIRFVRNIFRSSSKQLKYEDIDRDIDKCTLSFNDKNTELSQNQRKEVYNTFNNKKTEYENSLKRELENKLPNFDDECSEMQTQIVQDYIISEINKIQLQIK